MQLSQIPRKFELPFASSAGGSFINFPVPAASQIGITPGAASLTDGFPPTNFSPTSAGGIPPRGVDFNGLLFQITGWCQWTSAGGPIPYDAAFQTTVGGYPNGAVVQSLVVAGNYWQSTVDNNVTNPDTGGAGWVNQPGMMGTGHWQHRPVSDVISGWIISNGTTIGNAGSGATQRASTDCLFAFSYLWNKFSNVQCPVSGGRGATAAADFAALKTIGTLNMQATGVIGVDGMGGTATGLLANVTVVSGSATIAGSVLGENLHALLTAELAVHNHGLTDTQSWALVNQNSLNGWTNVVTGAQGFTTGAGTLRSLNSPDLTIARSGSLTVNNTGSGTAHNNVQRSMLVYWFMKL